MKKMWCIYTQWNTIGHKKNEILSFAASWTELKIIVLCEIRQALESESCITSLMISSKTTNLDNNEENTDLFH
jgi:hypothetical protein